VTASARRAGVPTFRLLALIVVAFIALVVAGMRNTSTTFDETLFPAAGARALETGDFTMVRDHPRLPQYLYGVPVWLMHPHYPAENGEWSNGTRYLYARLFFFRSGNPAEGMAFVARLVAMLCGAALVVATFLCARRHATAGVALLAAGLVALVPDVIAHSGITYNDVPAALTMLLAVYAIDRTWRTPGWRTGAVAGLAFGVALATKTTALVLGPIGAVLLALEALARRGGERAWWHAVVAAVLAGVLAAYAVLVAVYLADFTLGDLVECIRLNVAHVGQGHVVSDLGTVPAYLFGHTSATGWWYFFPVAAMLKTPFALHALVLVALYGAWASRAQWKALAAGAWFTSDLRAPVVASCVFGATLLTAHLQIGVRHGLPLVPFACILVAHGVGAAWRHGRRALRAAVVLLVAADVACVAAVYPYFLSYLTEAVRGTPAYEVLADSNTDWGQGLVALRGYMREHRIERIGLAYFGSALPEAYGIDYEAMPSHFQLPPDARPLPPPRYVAIALTEMSGIYFLGEDAYAAYRHRAPIAVVGGVFYIFERAR
jgi:hypothetical protein